MTRPGDSGDQKYEIAIFTCAFLAGGLLIITVILAGFMNPSAASQAKGLEDDYKKMAADLRSAEMKSLRAQAKLSESQDNQKTLKEIIIEQSKSYGLEINRFPDSKPKPGKGIEVFAQQITLRPAKLVSVLQFIAAVKEAKKSIQVERVQIDRERRGRDKEAPDSWTATLDFVDYVAK
jgi:hypothetical protein